MLNKGDTAPGFGLLNENEEMVHLSEFRDEKIVVLYFYPKDDTPGCTIEAQDFSRLKEQFTAVGVEIFGVSKDDADSHCRFRDKYNLGISLLADTQGDVCEKYGVWQMKEKNGVQKMGIVRSTFIIDKQSKIVQAMYNVKAEGHAQQVLDLLQQTTKHG